MIICFHAKSQKNLMNRFSEEDKRAKFKTILANFALILKIHKLSIKIRFCSTSNLLYWKTTPNFRKYINDWFLTKIYHRRTNRQMGMISKAMLVKWVPKQISHKPIKPHEEGLSKRDLQSFILLCSWFILRHIVVTIGGLELWTSYIECCDLAHYVFVG